MKKRFLRALNDTKFAYVTEVIWGVQIVSIHGDKREIYAMFITKWQSKEEKGNYQIGLCIWGYHLYVFVSVLFYEQPVHLC